MTQIMTNICFFCVVVSFVIKSSIARVYNITGVELVGGRYPSEGNVLFQLTHGDGKITAHVCDDEFGMREANYVCTDLGFPKALRFTRNDYFKTAIHPSWLPSNWTAVKHMACHSSFTRNVTSIRDCFIGDKGRTLCSSNEVAGVVCQTDRNSSDCLYEEVVCEGLQPNNSTCIPESHLCDKVDSCPNGSDEIPELCTESTLYSLGPEFNKSRLPENSIAGTLYMKYEQRFATVCDNGFDRKAAKVVCRGFGYEDSWSIPFYRGYFGRGRQHIGVDGINCDGTEASLSECKNFNWGIYDCFHNEDVGVFCHNGTLEVLLLDGLSPSSGRLEIKSSSLPYSAAICGTGFDDLDAQVVCRMLGYENVEAKGYRNSTFGSTTGPIWNISFDCFGTESSITECKIQTRYDLCNNENVAAVVCTSTPSQDSLTSKISPVINRKKLETEPDLIITSLEKNQDNKDAVNFESPWLAEVLIRTTLGFEHACSAVIISEFYLLSTAYCFSLARKFNKESLAYEPNKARFIVSVGQFYNSFEESTNQDFFIDELWIHEDYREFTHEDNDIALIKIQSNNGAAIRFNERIQPVCLPEGREDYEKLTSCTVTGRGIDKDQFYSEEYHKKPNLPRSSAIEALTNTECEDILGSKRYTSSVSCFGGFNNSVLDAGAAITCLNSQGHQLLYGLTLACDAKYCKGNTIYSPWYPKQIFARVTKYLRWIQEIIFQHEEK